MSDAKYTKDDAYHTLDLINSWINNVDTKTSFALAFVAVLIGFVFVEGSPTMFSEIKAVEQITAVMVLNATIVIALYLSSAASIIFMFLAIKARTKNKTDKESVMFFGTIANRELNDYKAKVMNMNEKDIIKDLLEQVHTNSGICKTKMKWYNWGIRCLFAATVLCLFSLVLEII